MKTACLAGNFIPENLAVLQTYMSKIAYSKNNSVYQAVHQADGQPDGQTNTKLHN